MTDPTPISEKIHDHEGRIGRLEGIVELIKDRLNSIENNLNDLRRESSSNLRRMIGVQIGSAVALGGFLYTVLK